MSESRSIRRAAALVFAFAGSSLACSEPEPSSDPFADEVVGFEPAEGSYFGHERMPDVVLGGPGGSLDVASLGCEGEIVVRFDEPGIIDGPGVDLIVFENPFAESFPEPGEVSVSEDGETWWVFACDPESGQGCAGVTPTGALGNPTDPDRAGGDGFDLASLAEEPAQVWFVRVRDRSREHWQPLGMSWCDPGQAGSGGFDLDALAAVHG